MHKPWLMSPFTIPHISSDKGSPYTLQTKRNLTGWMAEQYISTMTDTKYAV